MQVIGFGAGGHARVMIEILQQDATFDLIGLLDPDPELKGLVVLNVPVLGDDGCLEGLMERGIRHFFVGVGSVGDASIRRRLFKQGLDFGMQPVFVCHSQAVISPTAQIGQGVTIMAGAVINSGVVIGDNVIVNTGAIVEHDCFLGDHTHVATGARLAGGVRVNTGAHIGIGATIRELIQIGDLAIVGAGAVVVKNVQSKTVVVGVPARPFIVGNKEANFS